MIGREERRDGAGAAAVRGLEAGVVNPRLMVVANVRSNVRAVGRVGERRASARGQHGEDRQDGSHDKNWTVTSTPRIRRLNSRRFLSPSVLCSAAVGQRARAVPIPS